MTANQMEEIYRLQRQIEELRRAADVVCWFDWSKNGSEAVAALNQLLKLLK